MHEEEPDYESEEIVAERMIDSVPTLASGRRGPSPRSEHLKPGNGSGNGNSTKGIAKTAAAPKTTAVADASVPSSLADRTKQARQKGYEGDPCPECQQLTLVRSGACMKCDNCGATSGCS
jgi:ribonucleoside-diphosphate reductase alpha chain